MSRSRWIILIALTVAVFAVLVYRLTGHSEPVDVVTVSRGPLTVTVDEEGKTRVRDRFVISAPVAGYLRRITLDAGDVVTKGQVVAELEPLRSIVLDPRTRAEAEAEVTAAEAAVKAAEENLRAATAAAEYNAAHLERARKLFQAGYESSDSLDQAESDARRTEALKLSAAASLEMARSRLERARRTLRYSAAEGVADRRRIVAVGSPVSGHVLKLHRESEGVVAVGDALIDVGDPSKLEVEVEVLSADAVRIKVGTKVLFERWGGEPILSGTVRVVEPAGFTKISSLGVEEQRVLVIADIIAPPESWKKLGDRYRVEARFIIWEGGDVLQVPASALFRRDSGWAVFAVQNNRALIRQVEVGHRSGLAAEILSGVSEGDTVIVHPADSLQDGSRVRVRSGR
ncbi:MAG: efflux RND transporter periplasmic adaptor subunit [Chloroflexota bacterium]